MSETDFFTTPNFCMAITDVRQTDNRTLEDWKVKDGTVRTRALRVAHPPVMAVIVPHTDCLYLESIVC